MKNDSFYSGHPEFDSQDGIISKEEGYELTKFYVTYYWNSNKYYSLKNDFELNDLINEIYVKFLSKKLFSKFNPTITSKKYHVMLSVNRSLIDLLRTQKKYVSLDKEMGSDENEGNSLLETIKSNDDVQGEVYSSISRDALLNFLPNETKSNLIGNSPLLGEVKFTMRVVAIHLEQGYTPKEIASFFYNENSQRTITPGNVNKLIKSMRELLVSEGLR